MIVDDTSQSAVFTFSNSDGQGRLFDILIAKESFAFTDTFQLTRRPEPELINFADTYYGDPTKTSILMPSDVVPYKPRADVVVSANTYAPGGHAMEGWSFGVAVAGAGRCQLDLLATGPRVWQKSLGRWTLPDPDPVRQVPVRYEYALGGQVRNPDGQLEVLETNPVGCGWIGKSKGSVPERLAAPQIVHDLLDAENGQGTAHPAGLGAISPAWLPRRPFGGTFDEAWEKDGNGQWPSDYDFAFHNAAPDGLQLTDTLNGDETIVLRNLRPDAATLQLALPGTQLVARVQDANGTQDHRMRADTLYLDLTPGWPGKCLLALTWRLVLPHDQITKVSLSRVTQSDPIWANAAPSPHPDDIARAA